MTASCSLSNTSPRLYDLSPRGRRSRVTSESRVVAQDACDASLRLMSRFDFGWPTSSQTMTSPFERRFFHAFAESDLPELLRDRVTMAIRVGHKCIPVLVARVTDLLAGLVEHGRSLELGPPGLQEHVLHLGEGAEEPG